MADSPDISVSRAASYRPAALTTAALFGLFCGALVLFDPRARWRVEAATLWVHVDPDSFRPRRIQPSFHERYGEAACGRRVSARTRHDPVPPERADRYRPHVGKSGLTLGLRPEHIIEQRPTLEPNQHVFEAAIDVTEPMGMETLVHFLMNGTDVCGRVSPNAGARDGRSMNLVADLNNMHLIDDASGRVL